MKRNVMKKQIGPLIMLSTGIAVFLVGCRSPADRSAEVLPDPGPLPAWTTLKEDPARPDDPNPRRVEVEARFIEQDYTPGAENLPATRYEKRLSASEREAFLAQLLQNNHTDMMSAPRITTREGETACIQISQHVPYPSGPEEGAPSTNATLGVTSWVRATPSVDGNSIALDLVAEVKELKGWSSWSQPEGEAMVISGSGSGDPFRRSLRPVIETRRVDTSVRLSDGESILFGGILSDATEEKVVHVPVLGYLLGDIPLIKHAVRWRSTHPVKRELIVVVTAVQVGTDGKPLERKR